MRIFSEEIPLFCTIKAISSEEMGYNCTFIAISSEEIPFSSEEILRSGHEKSDILSNIASKQISKIVPFSGWGSLDMKTI
nr:MAG: hypothetical protein [Bacteriophage sp.]UWG19372.1 MAG: hypothetical protein [Bacteriophage sp.]